MSQDVRQRNTKLCRFQRQFQSLENNPRCTHPHVPTSKCTEHSLRDAVKGLTRAGERFRIGVTSAVKLQGMYFSAHEEVMIYGIQQPR